MLNSEALVSDDIVASVLYGGSSPNVDDVVSGRPGRSGNWAVELGGPKTVRFLALQKSGTIRGKTETTWDVGEERASQAVQH
jgi:hypothetical protein